MYLTIPSKDDIDVIDFIYSKNEYEIRSFDNLYCVILSEFPTNDNSNCSMVYRFDNKETKDSCFVDRSPDLMPVVLLHTSAKNIKEKGVFDDSKDGRDIYELGTTFSQIKNINKIKNAMIQGDFRDTGKKRPIKINNDGSIIYCKIYYSEFLNKNVIFVPLEEKYKEIRNSKSQIIGMENYSFDDIVDKKVLICEEIPLKWVVYGDKAMAMSSTILCDTYYDYSKSKLREYINSFEFQNSLGIDLQKGDVKTRKDRNPFKIGNLTLEDKIKNAMNAGIVPFLVGPPGVGKTETVMSLSSHVVHHNMAKFTPTSFAGKDYVVPGMVVKYVDENGREVSETKEAITGSSKPSWLKEVEEEIELAKKDGEDVILFLDEFDKLSPSMQVFINGIVDTPPTIADWKIPEGVKVVLAGNTTVDSLASNKISSEVASRLIKMEVKADTDRWIKWAVKQMEIEKDLPLEKRKIHPTVIAYMSQYPNDISTIEKDVNGNVDPNLCMEPRTWCRVSRELNCYAATGIGSSNGLLFDEYMTETQKNKFISFLDDYYNNYIDEILEGTADLYYTENIGNNVFIFKILSVVANESQLKTVLSSISNEEYRKAFIKNWVKYRPGKEEKAYEIYEEVQLEKEAKKRGL